MCDEDTVAESDIYLRNLSRRQFNTLTAGVAVAALWPGNASALQVRGSDVEVTTPDGTADAFLVHPAQGMPLIRASPVTRALP